MKYVIEKLKKKIDRLIINTRYFNKVSIQFQMLGGEVLEGVDTDVQMQPADSQDSQEMAMRTADKLLKELRPKPG